MEAGIFNPAQRVEDAGMLGLGSVRYNLNEAGLMQEAVRRGEGEIGLGGAFLCNTGKHTGRSPRDKFVVRDPSVEKHIWWEANRPMAPAAFEKLRQDMLAHMAGGPDTCPVPRKTVGAIVPHHERRRIVHAGVTAHPTAT